MNVQKIKTLTASVVLLLGLNLSAAAEPSLEEAYQTGRRAFYSGDFLTAKAKLLEVLERRPGHYPSKVLLKQAEMKLSSDTGRILRGKIEKTVIPKVDLDNIDLQSALDYLALSAKKSSDGAFTPSFIVRGEKTGERLITLKMGKVPMNEALRYISEMAKVNLHYDKFAVVVTPISTAPKAGEAKPAKVPVAATEK